MSPHRHGDVLNWASDIEDNTLEQAAKTAALPFVMKPLALMPDAHVGFGSTVGSVIATEGAIVPAAIGVDIGCGMVAVETRLTSQALPDSLGPLHGRIRTVVPAGVGQGHENPVRQSLKHWPTTQNDDPWPRGMELSEKQKTTASMQFGSLGAGNHFVEICLDERDIVWAVLHSGSRGIGNQLAIKHIDGAKKLMKAYFIQLADPDLAYLVESSDEFGAYIRDMLWAQDYAWGNRETMMDAVLVELADMVGSTASEIEADRVSCHHNFTGRENHHGRNVWLTRKGAIRARVGDRGVIPGSMGTRSYIVSGLGNPSSYQSCSHGAGRRMSRGQARRQLDLEGLRSAMQGKTWNDRDADKLIDEDPRSYKSIDTVMADQADLVTIEHTLSQVLNYKGL